MKRWGLIKYDKRIKTQLKGCVFDIIKAMINIYDKEFLKC